MTVSEQVGVRTLESADDLDETRLGAVGFVFHGNLPQEGAKKTVVKAGTNLLHFARCAKLEKAADTESKIWFRTIHIAKQHLDEKVGTDRWKWCKICEREITQKILNDSPPQRRGPSRDMWKTLSRFDFDAFFSFLDVEQEPWATYRRIVARLVAKDYAPFVFAHASMTSLCLGLSPEYGDRKASVFFVAISATEGKAFRVEYLDHDRRSHVSELCPEVEAERLIDALVLRMWLTRGVTG